MIFFHKSIGKELSCPQCIQKNYSASASDGETEQRLNAELKQLKHQLQVRMQYNIATHMTFLLASLIYKMWHSINHWKSKMLTYGQSIISIKHNMRYIQWLYTDKIVIKSYTKIVFYYLTIKRIFLQFSIMLPLFLM